MKKLIINADDFGFDENTTNSTIKLFEKGILTSATIMVDMPSTKKAIEYAKYNKDKSFGLHFNIVDEHQSCNGPNSLTKSDDTLFKISNEQRKDALFFKLNNQDIAKEFECQLVKLLDNGIEISHVDSHGHLHKFPQIITAIRPIMKKYKINRIRRPQNIFHVKSFKKKLINNFFYCFFKCKTTDYFFMLENHDNVNNVFNNFLKNIPNGVTELGIHPGTIDEWRKKEYYYFVRDELLEELRELNIKLINWKDF